MIAVLEDGTAYGWGRNAFGQVGNALHRQRHRTGSGEAGRHQVGRAGRRTHPVPPRGRHRVGLRRRLLRHARPGQHAGAPVPVPVEAPEGIVQLVSGGSHALALLDDGTVWSWGRDDRGQLGDGAEAGTRPGPLVQAHAGVEFLVRNVPAPVKGLADVTFVAVGGGHSLTVHRGRRRCPAGASTTAASSATAPPTTANAPAKLAVEGVREVAGAYHHTLVLLEDGTVTAFGLNDSGQLGNGETTNSLTRWRSRAYRRPAGRGDRRRRRHQPRWLRAQPRGARRRHALGLGLQQQRRAGPRRQREPASPCRSPA